MDIDTRVRTAAFAWLREQVELKGDVLAWPDLIRGFPYEGHRVSLVSMQGIFKPKILPEIPLSIRTSPKGPYNDAVSDDGVVRYSYRGTEPSHAENMGLRRAMEFGAPLVYFLAVVPGRYLALWPVYVVADDPQHLAFTVMLDDANVAVDAAPTPTTEADVGARRAYVTSTVRRRLHQRVFRERVLRAYREQCTMCRLRHLELLDAAHIIPDSDDHGEPEVRNGLALCKIHHAAFDRNIIGVRPDYRIIVRDEVLQEVDGPMLRYGLQALHGGKIVLPGKSECRPAQDLLEERYEAFKKAG